MNDQVSQQDGAESQDRDQPEAGPTRRSFVIGGMALGGAGALVPSQARPAAAQRRQVETAAVPAAPSSAARSRIQGWANPGRQFAEDCPEHLECTVIRLVDGTRQIWESHAPAVTHIACRLGDQVPECVDARTGETHVWREMCEDCKPHF